MNAFVVVGLENQASRGLFSRHSIAGRCIDFLAQDAEWTKKGNIESTEIIISDVNVLLVKLVEGKLHEAGSILAPRLLSFADPRQIIVLYDEALLPIGSAALYTEPILTATHMGLKNLIKQLGTGSFVQVGIGIDAIPSDKQQWEQFFNAPLSEDLIQKVEEIFPTVLGAIEHYIRTEAAQVRQISAQDMLAAQLPTRKVNLSLAPFTVRISEKEKDRIDRNIMQLLTIISQIANKYAQECHQSQNNQESKLLRLLEFGIPKEMVPWTRSSAFHPDNLSFDIQSGKLVEINAAPMPPLTLMNLRHDFEIVGDVLTIEMLTAHVRRIAERMQKKNDGSILLLNKIGETEIGRTGWLEEVREHLSHQGFPTFIGSLTEKPDARVMWANLTWMTPDRIPSVVSDMSTVIYPSPRNFLFTSKHFLALLHDEYAQEIFGLSLGNKRLIQEFIPRTFPLGDSLAKTLLETRTAWYMKPYLSSGGRGGGKLNNNQSLKKILRPAVIQEWAEPYKVKDTDYKYDIRVICYNTGTKHFVWSARVWHASETLQRPMDAFITIE